MSPEGYGARARAPIRHTPAVSRTSAKDNHAFAEDAGSAWILLRYSAEKTRTRNVPLPTSFDDQWREAIDRYQAAIVACEKIAEENARAIEENVAPTAISFSKEETARAELADARRAVLSLLSELRGPRSD